MAMVSERRSGKKKGRPAGTDDIRRVRGYLDDNCPRPEHLLDYLHRIQDDLGHLPASLLVALAHELRLAPAEVYEVASFYHHFDIVRAHDMPPPPLTVRVCDSIVCAMAGAEALIAALSDSLGDRVRVQRVPCVGRCDRAPIAVVGTRPIAAATPVAVVSAVKTGDYADRIPCEAEDLAAYRNAGGYRQLAAIADQHEPGREAVVETLEHARLRGLGGAGFPAGRKWRIVRGQAAPRLMAVNIDEGEPGTFKDRYFLERRPHQFLEGMLIAAQVVGVDRIYVYLRDEYAGVRALLKRELESLQAAPLPAIELRRGAGAYVCGEESAMLESIEGRRGMPRLRPPYVAEVGLFGRPTLEHNMETLYWVPEILAKGADWFLSHGRNDRRGLRSFSVSGRVRRDVGPRTARGPVRSNGRGLYLRPRPGGAQPAALRNAVLSGGVLTRGRKHRGPCAARELHPRRPPGHGHAGGDDPLRCATSWHRDPAAVSQGGAAGRR